MCKVIVFAGTTEGRQLAEFLSRRELRLLSVLQRSMDNRLLPSSDALDISHKRLTEIEMEQLFQEKGAP